MAIGFSTARAVLAATFFFTVTAAGQINTTAHRKLTSNAGQAIGRGQQEPQKHPSAPRRNLPFDQTVTIYYSAAGTLPSVKPPAAPSRLSAPIVDSLRSDVKGAARAVTSASQRPERSRVSDRERARTALQPVLIYYKIYRRTAAAENQSKPIAEAGLTAPVPPVISNDSRKTAGRSMANYSVSSPAFSNARAENAVRRAEKATPKDSENETIAGSLDKGSAVTQATVTDSRPEEFATAPPLLPSGSANPVIVVAAEARADASVAKIEVKVDAAKASTGADEGAVKVTKLSPGAMAENGVPIMDNHDAAAQTSSASIPSAADIPIGSASPSATGQVPIDRQDVSMDVVALNNLAIQHAADDRYTEAQELLTRAIDTEPTVAKLHRNLSIVLEKLKLIDEALSSARTAEKLSPKDPSIVEHLCGLELETGNLASALSCYERLESINPLDSLTRALYGVALFRAGKVEESIAVLEKSAMSTPPIPLAINALGVAYYSKKRLRDAAAAFKKAVEAAPEMYELRYNLAVAQLSLDNKAGAISQYGILKVEKPELAQRLYALLFSDKIVVVPKK